MDKRKFSIKEMFSKKAGKKNSKQTLENSYENLRENDIIKGRIYVRVSIFYLIFNNFILIIFNNIFQ